MGKPRLGGGGGEKTQPLVAGSTFDLKNPDSSLCNPFLQQGVLRK